MFFTPGLHLSPSGTITINLNLNLNLRVSTLDHDALQLLGWLWWPNHPPSDLGLQFPSSCQLQIQQEACFSSLPVLWAAILFLAGKPVQLISTGNNHTHHLLSLHSWIKGTSGPFSQLATSHPLSWSIISLNRIFGWPQYSVCVEDCVHHL